MPGIDLNHAAAFVRVVEAGSFTLAAKRLEQPASAVSRAVANLETELGVRLLHRTTRKLSLTDAGDAFFHRMQRVVAESDEAARAASGLAKEARGRVRLTAPPGLGGEQFPKIIAKISALHPDLVIELVLTNRMVDLVGEGIDLAVRNGLLKDSSLVARKVAASELGIFGAPAYLERRGRLRNPADLCERDCLRYGGREGILPWRLSGPAGEETFEVSGPLVCDDMIFLRSAAVAGLGLTLLPLGLAAAEVRRGELTRVLPRYGMRGGGTYLVWPSHQHMPAPVRTVRDLLLEELARLAW
jgi:DNA-binding transcriptional LysR family regulator